MTWPPRKVRLTAAVAVIGATVGVLPPTTAVLGQPDGWKTLEDRAHRLSLSIPSQWHTEERDADAPAIVAQAPDQSLTINVVFERTDVSLPVSDYASHAIATERLTMNGFHSLGIQPASVGGARGLVQEYSWRTNTGVSLAGVQLFLTREREGIVVTGTWHASDESAERTRTLAERIVSTVRILGTEAAAGGAMPLKSAHLESTGRRDLFAVPVGAPAATRAGGAGGAKIPLPPMPIPEAGGPTVPPQTLPALPGASAGTISQGPPPVTVRGIVLGATPQAILLSGKTYTIVTVGTDTAWGVVQAITATSVVVGTSSGSRTLTFESALQ